ncbi:hypothetical protein [Thalassoroseus pseudoceratinae]|uniref:hypothetical protein n=1 Tax=Thalassoroseus pseudoceratinae TaxID=2713176 RepID=UPI00141FF8C8|nr:hypothetical protein [Thalassoroseus pseudoceratinae]
MSLFAHEGAPNDPVGRAVAAFDRQSQAEAAVQSLVDGGFPREEIHFSHGRNDASKVDSTPHWFADIDDEIEWYKRKLENGGSVVSAPVNDKETLKQVHEIYLESGARMMTHFGNWITETENLDEER